LKFYLFILCLVTNFLTLVVQSQALPPVVNYTTDVYLGDNQNWGITQGKDKTIYIANNAGLLEFKGANWQVYPTPNKSILRSVLSVDNKIYSGCYMDFGYWEEGGNKLLVYHSLSKELELPLLEDEQFWNILTYENWLLFQSLNRIYFYNTVEKSVRYIESANIINKIFDVQGEIYYQVLGEGLFVIEDGKGVLTSDAAVFKEDVITSLYEKDGTVCAVMRELGIYKLYNGTPVLWNIEANEALKKVRIYNSIVLKDKSIVAGTIANGVYIISNEGTIKHHMVQANGLGDNTALSLFEDQEKNIWIGLDNGIDCLNLDAAFSNYIDRSGRLGTIYASYYYKDHLYLGTNQGLFFKKLNTKEEFKFVEGTEGQVWSLTEIDNTLFCGHNSGTFTIQEEKAELISTVMGTWGVKPIPNNPNLILQGNYDGLHILTKENGPWQFRNKLEGFNISSRQFEISKNGTILINHEYKGVYKLVPDANFYTAQDVNREASVVKGASSGLVAFNGKIFYANELGVYFYDETLSQFILEPDLSAIISEDAYTSGVMIKEENDRLWLFTKNYINLVTTDKINNKYRVRKIPIKETLRDQLAGFENITPIVQESYLLGTSNGYLMIDLDAAFEPDATVGINRIYAGFSSETAEPVDFSDRSMDPNKNFIKFQYSVPIFQKYLETEYQYRLLSNGSGFWSPWSTNSSISFQNLRYGTYKFEVKAKVNNKELEELPSYSFTVEKPWYVSNLAIITYIILFVLMLIGVNSLYKRYYRKQRERLVKYSTRESKLKELESQKKIIQLKNESLNQDISARNRELAISTMSTIKKNEALNNIKQELLNIPNTPAVNDVVKLIDETMNDIKDWKFFEEAFNSADKDFFKKVKELHPELTANDLRLCVYLRLNLSSKEIAPLLNISTRSVEIKRYRLRKKINLDKQTKLNDYFINL
jgi:AraC family transcriptional regulator, chitin signaling transcriptional activator